MKVIRHLNDFPDLPNGCVATIGNFDGVHLGHQALLAELAVLAATHAAPRCVVLFEPQPQEFFTPEHPLARLTTLREKCELLASQGVDYVLCLRFGEALAALTATHFIERVLISTLKIKSLIVGRDFRFGYCRRGDVDLLHVASRQHGFDFEPVSDIPSAQGERISSTAIRHALAQADLESATGMLGRPYMFSGRVVHGDKRGRLLGWPTANIALKRSVSPVYGVYAVRCYGLTPEPIPGVSNIGWRPTVDGKRHQIEVHLFNFNQDIYGKYVRIEVVQKIRNEQRFDGVEALKAQIQLDAEQARKILAVNTTGISS